MNPTESVSAVGTAWQRLAADGHVGLTNATEIAAAATSDKERQALQAIVSDKDMMALADPQAQSFLRLAATLPLPRGVENNRADAFFAGRPFTGFRLSKTHEVQLPKEMQYFNVEGASITGTLDDVEAVRQMLQGTGLDPVLVKMPDGKLKAIGTLLCNDIKDSTFGPYREVLFSVTTVPKGAPAKEKQLDYVNGFTLQMPVYRGAPLYITKLWLDNLSAIDGGNELLATNKELGAFVFESDANGKYKFGATDEHGKWLARGQVPRTITPEGQQAANLAFFQAAQQSGTPLPTSGVTKVQVASRPDSEPGKATRWSYTVDYRRSIAQEVKPEDTQLKFGSFGWGATYADFGFTPAVVLYSPAAVGDIQPPEA